MRMPRPPPPQLALSITGKPTARAMASTCASSAGSGGVAGITGTPAARRQIARLDLVAQPAHGVGRRADENDVRGGAGLGKFGTLGQEAVARMHRVGARFDGDAHDVGDIEIGLDRALAVADQVALVGLGPMQREAIFVRMDGDGANAEFRGGTHHANGDFTAIRDEKAFDGPRLGKWIHLRMMIALRHPSDQRNPLKMFGLAIHGGAGTLPRAK